MCVLKFQSYLLSSHSNVSLSNALSVSCTLAHRQPWALWDTSPWLFFFPFPPRLPVAGVESSQLYQLHHGNKNTLTCYSEDRAHYPAGAPRSFADWGLASTCMKLHTKALEKHLNQLTQTVQKSICHNCYYCLNSYNNSGSHFNQPVNKLKSSTRKGPTFLCCPGCRDQ